MKSIAIWYLPPVEFPEDLQGIAGNRIMGAVCIEENTALTRSIGYR